MTTLSRKKRSGIKVAAVLAMATSLVVSQPVYVNYSYAVVYEDCDLDGYDDATGAPMPWIGFDATKGDTIPSDWDGKTIYGSKAEYSKAHSSASENKGGSNENSGSSSSGSGDSGSSGNSGSSGSSSSSANGSGSSGDSGNSGSSGNSSSSSGNSGSQKSTSTSGNSTKSSGSSAKKENSSTKSSASSAKKENSSKKSAASSAKKEDSSKKTADLKEAEESPSPTATADVLKNDKKAKKNADKKTKSTSGSEDKSVTEEETGGETDAISEEGAAENTDTQIETHTANSDISQILATAGILEIYETDGSSIHAGGELTITGSGFAQNVDGFTIEIHSDSALNLGTTSSNEEGNFEIQVDIPETLEKGTHEIVVLYQGNAIASQSIEVGEKAASTFLAALTVGFSSGNPGLVAGILILIGLAAAGIVLLVGSGIRSKVKK